MTPQQRGPQHGENYQHPTPYPTYSQAWEFPSRVAQGTPQYGTHPLKYTPYIDVVNQHSDVLTETISGDLTFFINKFIELGFVTRTATANVLSQYGVGNGEKAGQLLSLLTAHYNRTRNKGKWFDKFVGVFSSDPAYENLVDMMRVALEKMRWSDFGSSVTEPLPQLGKNPLFRSPMDAFVHYIKIGYKQCEIEKNLNVLKWPPTPSKMFINLACIDLESAVSKEEADEYTRAMVEDGNVDVIMKRKRNIDFEDIARDLPAPNTPKRLVLVEGVPGVGKSTFAWEFCRRWERGEIAQQYQLVLLLRLRDERISRAKNLRDLIYHPSEDTCHHFAVELVDCHGINTLIILEGFDELPDPQRREPSIFLQLILGQLLPLATILVTSRPWATGDLLVDIKHRIFQHVEILGFTEENITKYVTSVFTGEGKKTASAIDQSVGGPDEVSEEAKKNIDDVMAYIGKYPQIKACMYIPLNAAIVVSIYRESMKSKWVLPTTLTELYEALTRILLLRHIRGHSEYSHQKCRVELFEDLPEEVYSQFLYISKIAYDGICREGWKSISVEPDPTLYLETFRYRRNHRLTHTSQYFDDLYESQDSRFFQFDRKSYALERLRRLLQSNGHNSVQLIFTDIPDDFETLGLMQSVSQLFMDGQKTSYNFLHLTFQEFLAAFLISTKSPAEQLEHFRRHEDGRLRVVLRFLAGLTKLNKVTPDGLRSLLGEPTVEQSDKHQTPYCNPMRPDVCVSAHHINWLFEAQNSELLQSLFHNHTASFTFMWGMLALEYYSVGYCIAHSHSKWSLTFDRYIEEEKLHMLVSGAKTGDGDYRVAVKTTSMTPENLNILVNGFISHVEEIYYLQIPDNCNSLSLNIRNHAECGGHVNTNGMEVITKGLSDNVSLPLKILDIDCKCTFTTTATRSLVQFITRSTTLQYLKILINTLEDVDILTKCLSDNIALPLKSLDIDCKCTFTTTATRSLVQFITRSTTLQYIRICHVTFSAQGLIELTEAVHHCSRLQEKKLEELTFHVECSKDVVNLKHMIKDHPDMRNSIDWNEVTKINIYYRERINENNALTLSIALEYGHVPALDLSNKSISNIEVEALAPGLHHNSTLKGLHLSNNNISDSGAVALAQALHHNSILKWLYLSNNNISDAGAVALAQALHHNSALQRLDLSSNDAIGEEGTHQLVQALTVNTSIITPYGGGGLILPMRCKEYATQCTQYNTVKDRIGYW